MVQARYVSVFEPTKDLMLWALLGYDEVFFLKKTKLGTILLIDNSLNAKTA